LAEGHTQAVGSDTSQKVVLTKSDVSILFVKEQPTGNRFEQLEIGDSFQFENMPRDFMNQAVQDRLHLLHALGAK
jgi:predicted ATPase